MSRIRPCLRILLGVALAAIALPAAAQTQADLVARTIGVMQNLCGAGPNDPTLGAGSCDIGFNLGGAQQAQAALTVSPRESTAASSSATHTTDTQVRIEADRLEEARAEAAAAGTPRWGGFVNGSGGFGTVDAQAEADEYDVWGGGITAGIDYRLADSFVAGLGFGWNRQNSEFNSQGAADGSGISIGGGKIETDSYTASLYGSFFQEGFHADGVLNYTYVDYDFKRPVILPDLTNVFATARGDTSADQFGVTLGGGYDFPIGALSLGPLAQASYRRTWIDGYSESGVPGFPLDYDDQDITSLVTSLGGEASYAISTGIGVFVPHLRCTWEHEFENDARNIDARLFLNDTSAGDILTSRTASPDRDYARLGAGFSAQFAGGIAAFFDYDTVLGLDDVEQHRFTAGGRIEF